MLFRLFLTVISLGLFTSSCQDTPQNAFPTSVPITGGNNSPFVTQPASEAVGQSTAYIPDAPQGRVFYVASDGNDAAPGTILQPWETLPRAVSGLQAGDTLYLKSGTYVLTSPLVIEASGNPLDGPITISTAPGEPALAVLSGDTNGDAVADVPSRSVYDGLVEIEGSHLRLQNLVVVYSKGRGISSDGSYNTISGNYVHQIWNTGIYISAADNIVEKNTVWRTADSNYCGGAAGRKCNGDWAGGIAWGDPHDPFPPGIAPRTIVRQNLIYHVSGEAIMCMHTDYGMVEGNSVFDNWAANIFLDQCSYTSVQKNLVYYTDDTTWWRDSQGPAAGILLGNEGISDSAGRTYPVAQGQIIINNLLVGNGINISFWEGRLVGSGLINDLIANNTLIETSGSRQMAMKIDSGPHQNTRIINNLILTTKGRAAEVHNNGGLHFSNNLWSKAPPPSATGPNDVIADPLLVDPLRQLIAGTVQVEWYQLTGTSPAVDKGLVLTEVTDDYWGIQRDRIPDIGAAELSR